MYNLHGQVIRELLRLRKENFWGIVFIWLQIYREIFKSVLQSLILLKLQIGYQNLYADWGIEEVETFFTKIIKGLGLHSIIAAWHDPK